MTDVELAYRKAEICKAWNPYAGVMTSNTYNHYARLLIDKLITDLVATGMSFERAKEVVFA